MKQQEDIIRHQKEREEKGLISSICTGTFSSSMGIPCWHIIKARQGLGTRKLPTYIPKPLLIILAITPADFHPHWHLDRPTPGTEFNPLRLRYLTRSVDSVEEIRKLNDVHIRELILEYVLHKVGGY